MMVSLIPMANRPRVGQLVVAEITHVGRNTQIEDRDGLTWRIFAGDCIVGAFGNRYATDQYEGYVPRRSVRRCDLLSMGGVCGVVASRHASVRAPTRLRLLGLVGDQDGRLVAQRAYCVEWLGDESAGEVILVVGASMNAGKTTVGGTLARSLSRQGFRVAAAKLTGTASGRDPRFYQSSGASPVLDFIDAGYPSTYLLDPDELFRIPRVLLSQLQSTRPDYIVLEVADGIFQRETAMLLQHEPFRSAVDHVFFAANDSLSAESGVRHLRAYGLPLRAVSGIMTQAPLAIREAEGATGVPCLSPAQIEEGAAFELMGVPRVRRASAPEIDANATNGTSPANGKSPANGVSPTNGVSPKNGAVPKKHVVALAT
jgi:hypothetical protein